MDHRRPPGVLDHHVRLSEALLHVPAVEGHLGSDVTRLAFGLFLLHLGSNVAFLLRAVHLTEGRTGQRRVLPYGGHGVQHRRQLLVLPLYQLQGGLGRVWLVGQYGVVTVGLALSERRQLRGRDDSGDAGVVAGLAGVDGLDAGVGMGAAQEFCVQHPRQLHVVRVDGLAGDLANALDAGNGLADDPVFLLGRRLLGH